MENELEDWGNKAIIRMTIDWVHELQSTRRGTIGEGVAVEHLSKLSVEIDRRKDIGSWVV